jgi:hypothetical protein
LKNRHKNNFRTALAAAWSRRLASSRIAFTYGDDPSITRQAVIAGDHRLAVDQE